jgi:hypothetical protein
LHPKTRWWIKADGCDVVGGLEELEWNGDIDLGTGELQKMYHTYQDRLKRVKSVTRNIFVLAERYYLIQSLKQERDDLKEDLTFIDQCKLYKYKLFVYMTEEIFLGGGQ